MGGGAGRLGAGGGGEMCVNGVRAEKGGGRGEWACVLVRARVCMCVSVCLCEEMRVAVLDVVRSLSIHEMGRCK